MLYLMPTWAAAAASQSPEICTQATDDLHEARLKSTLCVVHDHQLD